MKIEIAKNCGFCFGVKRAVEIAENSGGAPTIGELIHNYLEIERLNKDFGVKTLKSIDDLKDEKSAIIRTHGITKTDLEILHNKGIRTIDATCPFVKKPQQIAKEMSENGYDIVIFGDIAHPEVRSVMSYALTKVFVILDENELSGVKLSSKIAVLSQTTKKIEKFTQIVAYLMQKSKEVRVFNTICNATLNNQEAVRELANRADVMIIIGGKNSSNTKQLYLISKAICSDSYLIENQEELDKNWFKNKKFCGISAGASTPNWIIEDVKNKIDSIINSA